MYAVTSMYGIQPELNAAGRTACGADQVFARGQGMLPGLADGGPPRSASRFLFQTMMVKVL